MRSAQAWLMGIALLALIQVGCKADIDDDGDDTNDKGVAVVFVEVQSGSYSGIVSQRWEVIREPEDFTELWRIHAQAFSPEPAEPDLDFDQDMVIAVFLGERSTGGFAISTTSVVEKDNNLLVNVRLKFPADNCLVTQEPTQPYQIIRVSRSGKLVAFATEVIEDSCK